MCRLFFLCDLRRSIRMWSNSSLPKEMCIINCIKKSLLNYCIQVSILKFLWWTNVTESSLAISHMKVWIKTNIWRCPVSPPVSMGHQTDMYMCTGWSRISWWFWKYHLHSRNIVWLNEIPEQTVCIKEITDTRIT